MQKATKIVLIILLILVILFFFLLATLGVGFGVWYYMKNNYNENENINDYLNYNYNYNWNTNYNTNTNSDSNLNDNYNYNTNSDLLSKYSYNDKNITENASTYDILAYYPELTGLDDNSEASYVNNAIKAYVDNYIANFKSTADYGEGYEDEEFPSTLDMDYTVVFANDDLVSIEITAYEYYSGSAHGNSFTHGLNYDLNNKYELYLQDFFSDKTNFATKISEICIADLTDQLGYEYYDDAMLQEGAGPYADNFYHFTFDSDGMTFYFPPYYVAPYAAGTQEVIISYDEIGEILNYDLLTFLDMVS
ncbi:MAG: DUF3298 domain-containing protein [Patescibacteria group bacterium]